MVVIAEYGNAIIVLRSVHVEKKYRPRRIVMELVIVPANVVVTVLATTVAWT